MLVGLTLLKIGLARSLSEMLLFKEHFTFQVDGHDLRELENNASAAAGEGRGDC